jgi:hypothetical protein
MIERNLSQTCGNSLDVLPSLSQFTQGDAMASDNVVQKDAAHELSDERNILTLAFLTALDATPAQIVSGLKRARVANDRPAEMIFAMAMIFVERGTPVGHA